MSDCVYFGQIDRFGLRNGQGIIVYKCNRVYEGSWLNDMRWKRGYERYPNGNIY